LGQLISILTFPGVIIHEFSHEFFCRFLGVRVKKVCYFRFGNPAGYVLHEASHYFYQAFFVAAGPFILGSLLSAASFLLSRNENELLREYFWIWIGASIAFNCLPSRGDAKTLWLENWSHLKRNIFAILGIPFSALIWSLSRLDSVWLRIFYAGFLFYFTF